MIKVSKFNILRVNFLTAFVIVSVYDLNQPQQQSSGKDVPIYVLGFHSLLGLLNKQNRKKCQFF